MATAVGVAALTCTAIAKQACTTTLQQQGATCLQAKSARHIHQLHACSQLAFSYGSPNRLMFKMLLLLLPV
jgi:hypothetical protein